MALSDLEMRPEERPRNTKCAMDEVEIWRSADQFMKMHGPEASLVAFNLAGARFADGDMAGFHIWQRVLAAIEELSRQTPSGAELLN